ncbi:MAG: PLP-dependent transferase, partial [Actinomycetota bacterium]|nr:PLP-dependent transferase [Actinomycetota bacterium]
KMGIDTTFISDPDDISEWESAIRPETKLFYGESIGNPKNDFLDIKGISKAAHDSGIPLVVDNTVATPYLMNPLTIGADVVVHSMTKFIGGHGNSIGGVIIDGGNFDYGESGRFKNFLDPDPSYHGLSYWTALGHGSYIVKARVQLLRDLGASVTPQNSFNFLQGLETLSLRMERHFTNAQTVAEFLSNHELVETVQYAGLESSPWHDRAKEFGQGKGFGSVPAFVIKGGVEAGEKFVNSLSLHSHVANIGDVRSLVIHPASTTHSQLSKEEQESAGVHPGLVRLSVGLETIDDIIDDLEQGFSKVKNM